MTTKQIESQAAQAAQAVQAAQHEAHFFVLHCARIILLSVSPRDALSVAVYASELMSTIAGTETHEITPISAAIRDANTKMLESISSVPEEQLECSDDGSWAEGFVEAMSKFAPLAPGSLMGAVEVILHYLGGNISADNPLSIKPLVVPPDVQRLAHHLLSAYRKVMKSRMPR